MRAYSAILASMMLLAAPAAALAQIGGRSGTVGTAAPRQETPAYRAGHERGVRGGETDARANRAFDYRSQSDYRAGDAGYRREHGDRDRYRIEFRVGFEVGYREGYDRNRGRSGNDGWRPGGAPPPWANAPGRGGPGWALREAAYTHGWDDGYEAGLRDSRDRRRFNPTDHGRYRSATRGYKGSFGSREEYKYHYREAFRDGYERGFQDARRYDGRYSGRPRWWPW